MNSLSKRYKYKWEEPKDYLKMDLKIKSGRIFLSMETFVDRKIQELGLIDSYRGEVWNPHYTHKRVARDDSSSIEPDELYRRKVGSISWSVLGLRFDTNPIQLVFMTDADLGKFEGTRQSATAIMVFIEGIPIY